MKNNKHFDFYAPVFYPSLLIIVLFIGIAVAIPEQLQSYLKQIHNQICDNFGWLIILVANFFLVFCLYCAFSRIGKVRIGGKNTQAEFSTFAWFAMLFTAGMSSGALFFSVAEPITHFLSPAVGSPSKEAAASQAMVFSMFHRGFHGWAIYLSAGLVLAFFTFNKGLPLTISTTLQPIFKAKSKGILSHLIDISTILANLFGVALALVIAVQLFSDGLNKVFGLPDGLPLQLTTLSLITLGATISVVLGLKKGIQILSSFNLKLAIVLLMALLFVGPTTFILDGFVENMGIYLQDFIQLSTWTEAYLDQSWQNSWTLFYWIWWIAWSPFVGLFLARISKGRTVKEFMLGGLIMPTLAMFLWYSVFGGAALHLELNGIGNLGESVKDNAASGFFTMISYYPFSQALSIAFLVLAAVFFITSSDSASLVNDIISSGGKLESPKAQRIFWAVTEGLVAAILLSFGGYGVINGVVTLFGFVFMFVLLAMCYSVYKSIIKDL